MKKPITDITDIFNRFDELYGNGKFRQEERYSSAFNKFKKIYNENSCFVASSSGRVEVLGNHTDHNGGKVICASISLDSLCMFLPTDDDTVYVHSEGYKPFTIKINEIVKRVEPTSKSLVEGVLYAMKEKGYKTGGFKAYITSNVIGGAGISSSASFEVLITEIENFLYNDCKIDNQEKSIISQYAEREFFGKPCGLLDQSAIAYGGLNKIDFAENGKIKVRKINSKINDFTFILINTGGSHADLTEEYASIPAEMKTVARAYGKERLIEVDEEEFYEKLGQISDGVSDRAICRAIHFYNENKRVDKAEKALSCGDFDEFVSQINGSSVSSQCKLQNCYVSGGKDQLIPKAISIAEKFIDGGGVRIHGGGFAGCVLAVVKNDKLSKFVDNMKKYYKESAIMALSVRQVGTIVL